MASIRVRNNRLYLDFRFKGVRCREMTTLLRGCKNNCVTADYL